MRPEGETGASGERFAGDLFLHLATKGWLVVPPEQAERVIAELEQTLEVVRAKLRRAEVSRKLHAAPGRDVAPEVERLVVDSVFAGQIAADTWERALVELPKYIRAFRIAAGAR
ncbi:hypothetical protein [Actinosynnema pretiosum]|uniref:Uncharacterized protein n=1 Tax=Actinosynnema pretiosum TaxID=42197 RepID=A0A290Z5U1_9PSEU|nr:hypothetical protein [Actinosynnema pretiosum]ATE54397.1 hypothetical protein CNX65_14755 [Actinosynnema pretiosum]